jgi:hypothetical protein
MQVRNIFCLRNLGDIMENPICKGDGAWRRVSRIARLVISIVVVSWSHKRLSACIVWPPLTQALMGVVPVVSVGC